MVLCYKICKKYNEIQLTKYKMDLNNRKMTNHPPSPVTLIRLPNPNIVDHSKREKEFLSEHGY